MIYTLVIAGLWQASGLVMAILLAGLRGIDADLWKAARIDGIPTWRVYLSIVLPLLGPMIVTATVLLATGGGQALRPRRRHDARRPRHRVGSAGQVRHGPPVRAQQYRPATAAASVMLVTVVVLLGALDLRPLRPARGGTHDAASSRTAGRPRRLTASRIGVYAFLFTAALFFLLPLWIMVMTSLKTMDEIRLGNILAWPSAVTFEPWVKAWAEACTGLDCNGISVGFGTRSGS